MERKDVPMIYPPKCPRCDTKLECSGIFYGGQDEDYVHYDFEGYCQTVLLSMIGKKFSKLQRCAACKN